MAKTKEQTKVCVECKRDLVLSNFYNTKSPMFPDKKSSICKDCVKDKVDCNDINSVYRILQTLDIPFWYEYWDKAYSKNPKTAFGNYVRQANTLKQFKGKTYADSIFDSSESISSSKSDKDEIDNKKEDLIYSEDWRGTYNKSDLRYLDSYYKDLETDFKIITRNHKDYARKIAKASLAMDKAYDDMVNGVQGADTRYKNLKDTFDQLSKSAQFAEDKRGANDVGLGSFGVVFDKVEKHNWIPTHTPVKKDDYDNLLDAFSTIQKSL